MACARSPTDSHVACESVTPGHLLVLADTGTKTIVFDTYQLGGRQTQDDGRSGGAHYADHSQALPGFLPHGVQQHNFFSYIVPQEFRR